MKSKDRKPRNAPELRQQAEESVRHGLDRSPEDSGLLAPEELRRTVHELRVHQAELEMQNEDLRQAQLELDAARARYSDLYDLAPVGYCTLSEWGLIVEANLAAAGLLGVERDALVGQSFFTFLAKEGQDAYYLTSKRLFETGKAQAHGLRLTRGDGTTFWAHLDATVAWDEDRPPLCHVVLADISDRKQAEEELRKSEEKYRFLVENCYDIIYTMSAAGLFTFVAPAWTAVLGHPTAQVIGRSFESFVHPDDVEECRAFLRRVTETGQRQEGIEYRVRHINGTWRWHTSSAVSFKNAADPLTAFQGIARDITDRKRAEQALQEREGRHRTILHAAMDGFWLTDMRGRLLEVNDAYCRMSGYSAQELMGMNIADLDAAETGENIAAHIEKIRAEGEDRFEGRHRHKDGTIHDVEISVQHYAIEDGLMAAFLRDISDRKRFEEHRVKSEHQIRQADKMESLGRLAGGLAHDYNNMLVVILGYTQLALGNGSLEQTLRADLETIHKVATRSAALTNQLLAFARRQSVEPVVLNLNEAVTGLLEVLQSVMGRKIVFDWSPGEGLWTVLMDPSQIDQILANLCINARDAIADTGNVALGTENRSITESERGDDGFVAPGEYVVLTVSDNGCGMDSETLDKIFLPFFTTKEVGKGTGLGLATIYGIVKQVGGFIEVRSEVGHGTAFSIYLPRHAGGAVLEPTETSSPPPMPGKGTILLVEDNLDLMAWAASVLEHDGHSVLRANTPGAALHLAMAYTGEIDLLMTDVTMPEMSGHILAQNILFLHPKSKVLFKSGNADEITFGGGMPGDGACFITKPFSERDLVVRVSEMLHNGQPSSGLS
jgi:PAS domain S-box-containing protein